MNALLALTEVSKSYGAVKAVDGISFDVEQGRFFALLGPSGCGKTTLLRLIAGFETPDRGTLLLEGADLAPLKPSKRPVNLMFQSYALFPHMSVAGNIAYGLEAEGLARAEINRRTGEALELVKLNDLAQRKPSQLSGGQRQRVALARALVKRPKLLLLDEPLGALDKKLRSEMQIELKTLQRETGITFIVVTHDQDEALSMADTVCLLDRGRIVQIATPVELYERPETRFAAEFIGRSNMLAGRRTGNVFELDGLGPVEAANLDAVAIGEKGVLAIRPERIVLDFGGSKLPDGGRFSARIIGAAYFGSEAEIHVRLEAAQTSVIARLPAAGLQQTFLEPGNTVHVSWANGSARALA